MRPNFELVYFSYLPFSANAANKFLVNGLILSLSQAPAIPSTLTLFFIDGSARNSANSLSFFTVAYKNIWYYYLKLEKISNDAQFNFCKYPKLILAGLTWNVFKSFSTTSRALFLLAAEKRAAAYRPSVPDTWHGGFTSPALRMVDEENPLTQTRNWLQKKSDGV